MKKSDSYKKLFQKSHLLKDWLSYFSALTWEKYEKPHLSNAFKVYETDITNKLNNELFDAIKTSNLPLRIFLSRNEKVNGRDLEIVMPITKNKYIRFFCQAKRIEFSKSNPNGYYKLSRFRDNKEQIIRLLEYAQKENGFPIYMFYNHTKQNFQLDKSANNEKELYGCSLTSAHFLASEFMTNSRMKDAKFEEIHPPSKPLPILADMIEKDFLKSLGTKFGKITNLKKYPLKLVSYTEQQLRKEGNWNEIFPSIYDDETRRVQNQELLLNFKNVLSNSEDDEFNPAIRIMITTYPITERKID